MKSPTRSAVTDAHIVICGDDGQRVLCRRLESALSTPEGKPLGNAVARRFSIHESTDSPQALCSPFFGTPSDDAAIVLLNATEAVSSQVRYSTYLLGLVGIRRVALAIDGLDRTGDAETLYRKAADSFLNYAKTIGLTDVTVIPISTLRGDNVDVRGAGMPWYGGVTLVEWAQASENDQARHDNDAFRFSVQSVKPLDFNVTGLTGLVAGGSARCGDRVRIQPSGRESRVARIMDAGGDLAVAYAGQSVTMTLSDNVDVTAGDLVSGADSPAGVADQFAVSVVWMHNQALLPGRSYLIRIGAITATATVTEIKYRVNVESLEHIAAKILEPGEIGICNLGVDRAIPFDAYADNRHTGGFMLIDKISNETVGVGTITFALRRALNVHLQHVEINKVARGALKDQRPCVLWLTGLSGSGKSTIANLLEKKLHATGRHTYLLDGDNVRHGLNKDLGFTAEDRVENIRRIAEVAKLMVDAGLVVITAFISPFRAERRLARCLLDEGEFFEIHVETPLDVAEQRDVKGLYKKARRGELKNFTGIDSPYEAPEHAEFVLDTTKLSAEQSADRIIETLRAKGYV